MTTQSLLKARLLGITLRVIDMPHITLREEKTQNFSHSVISLVVTLHSVIRE